MVESQKEPSITLGNTLAGLEELVTTDYDETVLATHTIEYLTALPPEERGNFLDAVVKLIVEKYGEQAATPFYRTLILKYADADWLRMDSIKRDAQSKREKVERHAGMTPEEIAKEVAEDVRMDRLGKSIP